MPKNQGDRAWMADRRNQSAGFRLQFHYRQPAPNGMAPEDLRAVSCFGKGPGDRTRHALIPGRIAAGGITILIRSGQTMIRPSGEQTMILKTAVDRSILKVTA